MCDGHLLTRCGRGVRAVRRGELRRLPRVLVVHLVRPRVSKPLCGRGADVLVRTLLARILCQRPGRDSVRVVRVGYREPANRGVTGAGGPAEGVAEAAGLLAPVVTDSVYCVVSVLLLACDEDTQIAYDAPTPPCRADPGDADTTSSSDAYAPSEVTHETSPHT